MDELKKIASFKRKKIIGTEISRIVFLKDYFFDQEKEFIGTCYLGDKCSDPECVLIGFQSKKCKKM